MTRLLATSQKVQNQTFSPELVLIFVFNRFLIQSFVPLPNSPPLSASSPPILCVKLPRSSPATARHPSEDLSSSDTSVPHCWPPEPTDCSIQRNMTLIVDSCWCLKSCRIFLTELNLVCSRENRKKGKKRKQHIAVFLFFRFLNLTLTLVKGKKEDFMAKANNFIAINLEKVRGYFDAVASLPANHPHPPSIATVEDVSAHDLRHLHGIIIKNLPKITKSLALYKHKEVIPELWIILTNLERLSDLPPVPLSQ